MILLLDNLDGRGPVDYSAAITLPAGSTGGLTLTRVLNKPSTLEAELCLEGRTLTVPVRRARVQVSSDAGTLLFTGYLVTDPVAVYAGEASEGAVFRYGLRAASDEWLLDRSFFADRGSFASGAALAVGQGSTEALVSLLSRTGIGGFSLAGPANLHQLGSFQVTRPVPWSGAAGALAASAWSAYRVLAGAVTLPLAGSTTHTLSGAMTEGPVSTASLRELANDVLLTGELEPAAYWTELFAGDGATAQFLLTGDGSAVNRGHTVLVHDSFASDPFTGASFNPQVWAVADPGSHLGLSSAGLTLTGGNGLDGQTTLTFLDPVELGGTLVLELGSVTLQSGSAGVLGGLYSGAIAQSSLFAGFNIRTYGGSVLATPMINGAETGTSLTLAQGHQYTLRLRLHCPEMLRSKQTYYARVNGTVQTFGGGLVPAPMALVFEARDLGLASNTPATVLYDGAVVTSPAWCTLAAANSLQFLGSVGSVALKLTGSAWVSSRNPTGSTPATEAWTRLIDAAGQGADCTVTGSAADGSSAGGKVTFYAGRIPAAGETVSVAYRGQARAVARMENAASVAAEALAGASGTSRWLGRVELPRARSTEDCENAALAVLSFASSRAAAVSGACTALNPRTATGAADDLWPGDLLVLPGPASPALPGPAQATEAILRRVEITSGHAVPELLRYRLTFANEWAEALGLTLTESVAADALLPPTATDSTLPASARVLPSLPQFTVLGPSGSGANLSLTVDAGTDPPTGGGFEVRRRDGGWGQGGWGQGGGVQGTAGFAAGDLVLRSPVRGFSIPVSSVGETFFIRMYDSSTPPLYSRASSAVVSNLPIS